MKSNARLIKVASAVICSCAIATTAFAVPSNVNDLVEKVYLPYTKYKNPFEDINKYEAEIRKIGCRVDEGRNSWVLYQSGNNKPCMDMPGVTHVAIRYSTEVPSLMVIAESGTAKFNEIERYEKLTSVKDAETQTTTHIYQNGDIRYGWVKDYKGFSVLTMRMDKSPAVSQATPQNAQDSAPNAQPKASTVKETPQTSNTQPSQVSSSDGSGGLSWLDWLVYLAGALVLVFGVLSYFQRQKLISQKIKNHQIWQGATKRQVLASWGKPDAIDKRPGPRVTWEGWFYGGQTEKTAKRVVWFRSSSNKGEEGVNKWEIKR